MALQVSDQGTDQFPSGNRGRSAQVNVKSQNGLYSVLGDGTFSSFCVLAESDVSSWIPASNNVFFFLFFYNSKNILWKTS